MYRTAIALTVALVLGAGDPADAASAAAAPTAATAPAAATDPMPTDALYDGFDGPGFARGGGLYYKENAEQAAGRHVFDPGAGRSGGGLRLSVRPFCDAGQDLCSERAEIWERPKLRLPYSQGVWFGFAVKFVDPIPTDDHRYLIAQWKREIVPGADGDFSPFLALRLRHGKLFATVEADLPQNAATLVADHQGGCTAGRAPVWYRPETNQQRALVATQAGWQGNGDEFTGCAEDIRVTARGGELPDPHSGWIDFAVYAQPGPQGDGRIELFANGRWIVTVAGRIGHAGPGLGPNQYFKFGPYRAAGKGEWGLVYDDFRRSLKCEDVLVGGDCPR